MMKSRLLFFSIKLVSLTLIMYLFFYLFKEKIPARYFYQPYIGLLFFFFAVTFLLHTGYESTFSKGGKYFVRFYMLTSGLKLFAFLTIIIVYSFVDKAHIVAFAINFLLLYFVYTAFELIISYKKFGAEVKAVK